jgi:hypothetical protein
MPDDCIDPFQRLDAMNAIAISSETSKPDLIINGADRPATVDDLRELLAQAGDIFDRGGVPVRLVQPAMGGVPIARRMTYNNVIVEAHRHCRPVRVVEVGREVPITLPENVAKMYLDLGEWGLQPLAGITTAPVLTPGGSILARGGYYPDLALWCVPSFDITVPDCPTRQDAEAALLALRAAFATFPFKDAVTVVRDGLTVVDTSKPASEAESSFQAGLMTAICRPSLYLAPGLLVVAPDVTGAGTGKGLLVRCINAIAYGCQPAAFTAGHDRQELDKRLVADLIEAAPCLFLDNVNATALRSATLASVLTERPARVRVMGLSQMMPLNSAAFIAVAGNGLSVSGDLARRFLAVDLDAQCEDPEARPFPPGFLATVQQRRNELLTAALTIWRWGRQNSDTLTRGVPLGSFGTWSEWVRDPLLTLGCTDPVARILSAKANDPRRRFIADLFSKWWEHHSSRAVSAADLADPVQALLNPQGRARQYVAQRLAQMEGTRAAGFVLTRQPPAGKWAAATYALMATASAADDIGHRTHRGDEHPASSDPEPMTPMGPMPYAGDDADIHEGEL